MSAELTVITPEDVSAFVDGELGREEHCDVAACAHDDDRVALRITAWRWQLGLLHSTFGAVAAEPVPDRLARIARRAGRSGTRRAQSGDDVDDRPRKPNTRRRAVWPMRAKSCRGASARP